MQYPYPASTNNVESTRNSVKTNNTEKQQRDTKDSNVDLNHKSSRHRDTGKSDDNSSNGTFAMNNTQNNTKQQSPYVCAKPIIVSDGCEAKYPHGKKPAKLNTTLNVLKIKFKNNTL